MRRRSRAEAAHLFFVLLAVLAAVGLFFQPVVAGATPAKNPNAELNHPEYYENLGYGTCSKTENPDDPYTLGAPPAGMQWTLLVLKAGSEQSNDDWNTMIEDPAPGQYVHPSGKDLSHVITCYDSGGGGSTTTTSTTSSTTTVPGGPCDDYTPTQVSVQPMTVMAGDSVTITGMAKPGDTVTATLQTAPPYVLGSDVADGSGQFSITGTIPPGTSPGNYTITVESQQCPTSATVTITVVGTTFSGCGYNSSDRTFEQGQSVVWSLHVPSFSTSHPVELRLKRSGYDQQLYNGPWPPSDEVTITIPATAPTGQYWIHQIGTKKNGKGSMEKKCPVWVVLDSSNVGATGPASTSPVDDGGTPLRLLLGVGAMAVGGYSLMRLNSRRALARTFGRMPG